MPCLFPLGHQAQISGAGSTGCLTQKFSEHPSETLTVYVVLNLPPFGSALCSVTLPNFLDETGMPFPCPHPGAAITAPPSHHQHPHPVTRVFCGAKHCSTCFTHVNWSNPHRYPVVSAVIIPTLSIRMLRPQEVGVWSHPAGRWQSRTAPGTVQSSALPYRLSALSYLATW